MTLDYLAERENALMDTVNGTYGEIEYLQEQLQAKGVFDEYKKIHCQYADLAYESSEALKRGLFIQWAVLTCAYFSSGISDIYPQIEYKMLQILDNKLIRNEVDLELRSMISYYAGWEFVYDRFSEFINIDIL